MKTSIRINSKKNNFVLLILFSNLCTYLNYLLDWPFVRLANQRVQGFIDLNAVLRSIECAKFADPSTSLDSLYLTCNYIYGSPLLIFGQYFGFSSLYTSYYVWILLIISSSLIGAMIYLSIKNFKRALLSVGFIICSPAISFLFERANIDIIIFISVIFSAWLYSKKLFFLSISIILGLTLLKFYTLFLLIILTFLHLSKKNFFLLIPITTFTTLSVFVDLERIEKIPASGRAQFGTGVFSWYFDEMGFYIEKSIWILIGIGITSILTYMFTKSSQYQVLSLSSRLAFKSASASEVALGWSSIIFLSCFLIGFNYDYRLIFLAFGGFLIFRINNSTKKNAWELIYLISLWGSIGIGLTFPVTVNNTQIFFVILQFLGDVATLLIASYLLAYFIRVPNIPSLKAYLKFPLAK